MGHGFASHQGVWLFLERRPLPARDSGPSSHSERRETTAAWADRAHTTEDRSAWGAPPPELVIAHTNLYWGNREAPGRTAGTVEAKDVNFATS
jgi:hypothetical protein